MRKLLRAVTVTAVLALSVAQASAETLADALISAYKNSNFWTRIRRCFGPRMRMWPSPSRR